MAPDAILGRAEELAVVAGFLDHDSDGLRAMLIEGEPGIGKTTVWSEAVRVAGANGRVLTARASEAEAKLSFTVLTDLIAPVLNDVDDDLPPPQRRALHAALLLEEPASGTRLDARAVSLGALGAIRSLAAAAPVTLAIDDVQWIDAPSSRALLFALRRLVDEPVTVIAATRTGAAQRQALDLAKHVSELHRVVLGPFPTDALGRLLRRLGQTFPRPLVLRIHHASGGNPFFALEIGRALLREGILPKPGEPLPVPEDLHALLRDRLAALPADARDILLITASSAAPTVQQFEALGQSHVELEDAARAGIIIIRGSTIQFTHPLLASTVYADAEPSLRRDVHRRLAEVAADIEEQARHLALSSTSPNAEVARALDDAALHARARGAPQAAAELSELALESTPKSNLALRQRRATSQAGNLFDAGDPPRARQILGGVIASLEAGPARAEALYLLSAVSWKDLVRVSELLQQALLEVGGDARLRSWILSDLAWVGLDMCDPAAAADRGRAAVELAESVGDDFSLRRSLSIVALADSVMGLPASDLWDRAVALQGSLALADLSSPATCLGRRLTWAGDLDTARQMFQSELTRYREQGHETACYEILAHLAEVEYRAGRLMLAAQHLDDAHDLADEAGIDVFGEILPVTAAVKCATGDVDGARSDAIEGLAVCDRTGDLWNKIRCRSVLGRLELSLDEPAAACAWLEPLPRLTEEMGLREPGVFPFVPDFAEALVATGELEQAQERTNSLVEQARAFDRPTALGTAERCEGLIAAASGDLAGATAKLRQSILQLQSLPEPFELARTLLVAGQVERRMKQKASSRELLGRALAIFEELGAPLWHEKAQRELARIGGRSPSPTNLTPTEEQVARLVAEGRTNREVANALFVSVHTVEANLKRIYRKLGIRSRTELANEIGPRSRS